MTSREMLLRKISTYAFAIHEYRLFLDTHPKDEAMIAKIAECEEKLKPLKKEYEEKYGPLKMSNENPRKWTWVNDPWPWEGE
ncbi:MAG: spore coat protein CotJB [Ruminococcus sp.]|nr:spore coat protein CotJB [Ruminococcus sp.]